MVQIELPHVNVLSKIDIIEQYGKLGIAFVYKFISSITSARCNYMFSLAHFFNDILLYLDFSLDYYTEVLDLKFVLDELQDNPVTRKFKKLNKALISVIEDYSLVSFLPLNVQVVIYFDNK